MTSSLLFIPIFPSNRSMHWESEREKKNNKLHLLYFGEEFTFSKRSGRPAIEGVFSLALSVSHTLFLTHSLSLSLSPSLSVSQHTLSISLCLTHSLSVSLSLCLCPFTLSLSVSHTLFLSLSLTLSRSRLSLHSLSLSVSHSLSLSVSLSHTLSLSFSFSLSLSVSLSLTLSFFLSRSISLSLSFSISIYLCRFPPLSHLSEIRMFVLSPTPVTSAEQKTILCHPPCLGVAPGASRCNVVRMHLLMSSLTTPCVQNFRSEIIVDLNVEQWIW